jgi:hypothetical protein
MSVDLFINMYAFIVVMIGCGLGLIVAATTILCIVSKEQVVHIGHRDARNQARVIHVCFWESDFSDMQLTLVRTYGRWLWCGCVLDDASASGCGVGVCVCVGEASCEVGCDEGRRCQSRRPAVHHAP